jgi:hypothetical protein
MDKSNVITGAAPIEVIKCRRCSESTYRGVPFINKSSTFDWCIELRCPNCDFKWFVCNLCPVQRSLMTNWSDVTRHNRYRKHNNTSNVGNASKRQKETMDVMGKSEECENDGFFDDNHLYSTVAPDVDKMLRFQLPGPPDFSKANAVSQNFFASENAGTGLGCALLVGQSQFQLTNIASKMQPKEVTLQIEIAELAYNISTEQRRKLASILNSCEEVLLSQRENTSNTSSWPTSIPRSLRDIRSFYLEGKWAIIPNLPRPAVQNIGEHAYVSLTDCVVDMLGHGISIDIIENASSLDTVRTLSESLRAKTIANNCQNICLTNNTLCLYVVEWSDAFEPSYSIKSNRGSVWLKTITISPPHNKLHCMTNTYPIAVGPHDVDHEEVEQLFAQELLQFRCGKEIVIYHGKMKKNVKVYLDLLCSLQDQPERRSCNYIAMGNSRYTAKWGVSIDYGQVYKSIPACQNCWLHLARLQQIRQCRHCTCWDVGNDHAGLLRYQPPSDYPSSEIDGSGKLGAIYISYSSLKTAVKKAHDKYISGDWSISNMKAYLKVNGLNEDAIGSICARSRNVRDFNDSLKAYVEQGVEEEYYDLKYEREKNPVLFEIWKYPAVWERGTELSQHIDTIMHLVFLGVVKTTILMIHQYIADCERVQQFIYYATNLFESVSKYKLSWCKSIPYKKGSLGGWVSENFIAACRLMNWFYSGLDVVIKEDVIILAPEGKPQSKWTKKENMSWLKIRGLTTKGLALELKERVSEYMNHPAGPPDILPPRGSYVPYIFDVLTSLKAMVARIMTKNVTEESINDVDIHIKIFLQCFHRFDITMQKKDVETKPKWLTSYNFISLTNIPNILEQFGPVRNLWEGGGLGEKIIQLMKPTWFGFRKNWQVNMMDRLLKSMALSRIRKSDVTLISEENEEDEDDTDEAIKVNYSQKLVHVYKSEEDVNIRFLQHEPLSIVVTKDNNFACLLPFGIMKELNCSRYHHQKVGANYYVWRLGNVTNKSSRPLSTQDVKHYCLLLPQLFPDTENNLISSEKSYTLIDNEWNEISVDKTIKTPDFYVNSYSS